MRRLSTAVAVSLALALAGCGSAGTYEPTDERPSTPKKVAKKYIDPAHYSTTRKCVKRNTNGTCGKWETKRKLTDDKDWVLITSDGVHYDVSESEYNRVRIGDYWR